MSGLASAIKSEITRLARKEVRAQVEPLRKANAAYRRDIAELKRQVVQLERQVRVAGRTRATPLAAADGSATKTRFVAKGLRSLRSRLGLSAAEFGRLAGASGQSVYNWEAGKTVPARSQQEVLAGLRGLGKREARARLEAMPAG
jgi:DNA-binding transcriptional regulator YiaG